MHNFLNSRCRKINYYKNLLKENEYLLLKSKDDYFKNHYISSPLADLTGFKGSEGEAIVDWLGNITLFVDTRYHLLVDRQKFDDIKTYKMNLNETFFDAFKNTFKKDTVLYVPDSIDLSDYLKYRSYFDLRKYTLEKKYDKNIEFKAENKIFSVGKNVENYDFSYKFEKLKNNLKVDKLIIFNLDVISYLTNLRSYQMRYSSNFRAILYLDFKCNKNILFLDKNNKNASKEIEINNLEIKDLSDFPSLMKLKEEKIALDYDDVTLKNYLLIKNPLELSKKEKNYILILSSIKPFKVIETMKNSFKALDSAIFSFKNKIKKGLSEYDLVKIFEKELIKKGARQTSFKTILSINENTASIHYSSYDKNKILNDESLILLDCGGYFEGGFATDITRVFYFGKNPNPFYKKIYTNVLKAFLLCYMSNENDARKLDLMAREFLKPFEKEGFYFNHALGHGIATSCHQNPPRLSALSNDIIKPFQTHSIEPGLYGKNNENNLEFGIRIENCVYNDIDYNKISLSKFPFEEILIDYDLLTQQEKDAIKYWNYYE